jgi:hypothetical protein
MHTPTPIHGPDWQNTPQSLLQANTAYFRLLPSSATTSATASTPFRPQTAPQLDPSPAPLTHNSARGRRENAYNVRGESSPNARARTATLTYGEDSKLGPPSCNAFTQQQTLRIPEYPAGSASLAETLHEVHLDAFSPPQARRSPTNIAFASPPVRTPSTYGPQCPQQIAASSWKIPDCTTPGSVEPSGTRTVTPQSGYVQDRSYTQRLEQQLRELERYNISIDKKVRALSLYRAKLIKARR